MIFCFSKQLLIPSIDTITKMTIIILLFYINIDYRDEEGNIDTVTGMVLAAFLFLIDIDTEIQLTKVILLSYSNIYTLTRMTTEKLLS